MIASGESVIGPLATAEPAIYWVNGTSNAIRVHESGTTATLFTNTSGGPLTAVAVAGGTIAWAEDKGIKVGGVLHLDQLNAIGAGPSATGVVPHSMQLIGSTVLGVAEDKGQGNADLFIYTGASTYDSFRQLTLPVGNAVTTSDGWVYAVANGALQGLSTGKVPATTAGPILPVIATNSVSAFFINGNKQVVKTVGVAIAPVAMPWTPWSWPRMIRRSSTLQRRPPSSIEETSPPRSSRPLRKCRWARTDSSPPPCTSTTW